MKDNLNFWTMICAGTLAFLGVFSILLSPISSTLILNTPLDFKEVYFSKSGTIVPLFGYALLIAGGILLFVSAFKGSKKIGIIGMIILLASALVIFLTRQFFILSKMDSLSSYQYELLDGWYSKLGLGPILGGVAGLVSAFMAFVVFFVFDEQGKIKKRY